MLANKQRQLLLLAALLAALQFWVLPTLARQSEQRNTLQQLASQLARVQSTASSAQQLEQALANLPEFYQALTSRFIQAEAGQASGQLRISLQQQLQQQAINYQVQVSLFEWLGQTPWPEEAIEQHQLRLTLTGSPAQLAKAYLGLFGPDSAYSVQQASYRQRPQGRNSTELQATLTLVAETLILLADVQPPALAASSEAP